MPSAIQYLKRSEIDDQRWDSCVRKATNGLAYAHTWWLDNMSPGWNALVTGDYDAIMPLTSKKKYGVHYLYQPWFTANLGVFFGEAGTGFTSDFLRAIPAFYKWWEIDLNENNFFTPDGLPKLEIRYRKNMLVAANKGYAAIFDNYSRLAKRKLNRAAENKLLIDTNYPPASAIEFYRQHYQQQHPGTTSHDYEQLVEACTQAERQQQLCCFGITRQQEVLAVYIVLKDLRYCYSLLGGSSPQGKTMGAFYLATDAALQTAAANGLQFRFEGSDIPGIAYFNRQFGANEITYPHLKMNGLPSIIKLFKN